MRDVRKPSEENAPDWQARILAYAGLGAIIALIVPAMAVAGEDAFAIQGRVLDERLRSLGGAVIEIRDGDTVLGRGTAGKDGRFAISVSPKVARLRDHAFGPVAVVVRTGGYSTRRLMAAAGGRDIRIVLPRERPIRGTVRDTNGAPMMGIKVSAATSDRRYRSTTTTDSRGQFAFADAGADVTEVTIYGDDLIPGKARVPPSGTIEARASRLPLVTFEGKVIRESDAAPVPGARIHGLWAAPVSADAQGGFAIRLLRKGVSLGASGFRSGEGFVQVVAPGYAVAIVPIPGSGPLICRVEPIQPLEGRVVDVDGAPIRGARIMMRTSWLHPIGGAAPVVAKTNARGDFRFDSVPTESYASDPAWSPLLD